MEIINNALFCDKCLLQFDKKIVFDIHLSFVHKMSIKIESEENSIEIKNEDTDSAFQTNSKKPNQNIINPIDEGNKPHKCKMCNYTTSLRGHLNRHIELVHEGKKPHICSICDYSFSEKGSLKKHIESAHEEKKPHKCSICDYSSSRNNVLKIHMESVHEGRKPHNCSICGYSFSQKSSLKRHIKSVHEGKLH